MRRLCDWPRPLRAEDYERTCDLAVKRLAKLEGLVAVYRLGSWREPGISDLDLAAVFEDGATCAADPLEGLDGTGKAVFRHGLFGIPRRHLPGAMKYSGLWGFSHLRGEMLPVLGDYGEGAWEPELKVQLAHEFLLRLYVNQFLERAYGVHRVRGFLLQARGARYDLQLLAVREGAFHEAVAEVGALRAGWFRKRPAEKEVLLAIDCFFAALADFLRPRLAETPLAASGSRPLALASNMLIRSGEALRGRHRGLPLPPLLTARSRKLFNLQHGWNRFLFEVPLRKAASRALTEKARFDEETLAYNERHLPRFTPLKSPLHLRPARGKVTKR